MARIRLFPYLMVRQAGMPFSVLKSLSTSWVSWEHSFRLAEEAVEKARERLQSAFDTALVTLPRSSQRTAIYNARRAFYQRQRLPCEAHIMMWKNVPELAPIAEAASVFRQAKNSLHAVEATFARQYEKVLLDSYCSLQALAQNIDLQRSLLFSSHQLLSRLLEWRIPQAKGLSKKDRQTALSVLQYVTRMATRPTPLGRLATVTLGVNEESSLSRKKCVVVPNSSLLPLLYDKLLREPVFFHSLRIQLNPCICTCESVEYVWLHYAGEKERIQRARADESLQYVVKLLLRNNRSCDFATLCTALMEASGQSMQQIVHYVLHLVETGFLEWVLPVSGLSSDWSKRLHRYLISLPASPTTMRSAALLQDLERVAHTITRVPTEKALKMQQQQAARIIEYCHEQEDAPLFWPAEQIFYEDVVTPSIEPPPLESLVEELAGLWCQRPSPQIPPERQAFLAFAYACLQEGHSAKFLSIAEAFLRARREKISVHGNFHPPRPQCLGALFQVWAEKGQWYAVLNALYPGGGKLFARWLQLFPAPVTEALRQCLSSSSTVVAFPWQGYSNANFQPPLAQCALVVPGGRVQPLPGGKTFLLGNLAVGFEQQEAYLYDMATNQRLVLIDLGMEAPESRPPVMRLLWQIGVPYASRQALLPSSRPFIELEKGVAFWPRYLQGRWLLERACWRIEAAIWKSWINDTKKTDYTTFRYLRAALSRLSIPRYFTVAWSNFDEPMFFDADSPWSLRLFWRKLCRYDEALFIREYWPLPERRAQEWVVEFKLPSS